MNLHAGFPFRVAPRFHSHLAWTERLQVNSGVESVGECFYARGDWRAPDAQELALLLGADATAVWDAEAVLPSSPAALLTLPSHLRAAWWSVAEGGLRPASVRRDRSPLGRYALPSPAPDSSAAGSRSPTASDDRFDDFVAGVIEFLRFKRLPLPERCQFDVVASRPGQRSTRLDPTGALAGLRVNCTPAASAPPGKRLVATMNLGDEATHVVLLNLLPTAIAALLPVAERLPVADSNALALWADFLATVSDYPLVRVRLDPGDGLWLPDGPVVYDGDTLGKRDIDVALMIQTAGRS